MSTAIAISRDKKLAKALRAGLLGSATNVTTAPTADALPKNGTATLLAVHADANVDQHLHTCVARAPSDARMIAVMPKPNLGAIVDALQVDQRVAAVVTVDRADKATISRIASALSGSAVFGLTRFVGDETEVHSAVLSSFGDKLRCLDQIEELAKSHQVRAKYREAILQCADEMLMNALYIAPREAATAGELELGRDKQSVVARAQRAVEVQYAHTRDTMWVAVRDQYGSIRRDTLLEQWQETIRAHENKRDTEDHSLGVYIMSNSSTSMHLHLAPGVATEVVCSFDLKAPKLQLREIEFVEERDAKRIAELKSAAAVVTESGTSETGETGTRSPIVLVAAGLGVIVLVLLLAVLLR